MASWGNMRWASLVGCVRCRIHATLEADRSLWRVSRSPSGAHNDEVPGLGEAFRSHDQGFRANRTRQVVRWTEDRKAFVRTNRIPSSVVHCAARRLAAQNLTKMLFSENQMRKNNIRITALAFVIPILFLWPDCVRAQAAKAPYPVMAPLDQYLIPEEKAEIALARSSAPASISDSAEVMVLRRDGYATAVKGSNGFVCIVQRSWAKPTDDPEFWNLRSAPRIASIRQPQGRFCPSF